MRNRPVVLGTLAAAAPAPGGRGQASRLRGIDHIVVIYEENHSFDNLYGGWEGVDGLATRRRAHDQVDQAGAPYTCLLQNDVNLTSPPLAATARTPTGTPFTSHFPNAPFQIEDYIAPDGHDVPAPGVVRAQRRAQGQRAARRLHARPRPPLLPGAVPARRRPAGPLRDRQRRRRPDDGPLRHAQAADLHVPAHARAIRAT